MGQSLPLCSKLDHAEDFVEESQEESHNRESDYDRHHRDDQIEEGRHDRNNAGDDRRDISCKVKGHVCFILKRFVPL